MKKLIILLLLIPAVKLYASHNRGGEIIYKWVSGLTYEVSLITYTDFSTPESQQADRPNVNINWGDGVTSNIARSTVVALANYLRKSTYTAKHTYVTPNFYTVSFSDPNRIANIVNMTNSFLSPFYIESVLKAGPVVVNHSHLFHKELSQLAYIGQKFVFDPAVSDAEGDSLVFSLVAPKESSTTTVSGYVLPNSISGFSINQHTGVITWNVPVAAGIYVADILTREFRNGVEIGSVQREMILTVSNGTFTGKPISASMVTLYPNPSSGLFMLHIDGLHVEKELVIAISDVSGKLIMQQKYIPLSGAFEAIFEPGLPAGIYMVQAQQGNQIRHTKLIVQ